MLCILVEHDELTSEIPPFKTDKTGDVLGFYNWREFPTSGLASVETLG